MRGSVRLANINGIRTGGEMPENVDSDQFRINQDSPKDAVAAMRQNSLMFELSKVALVARTAPVTVRLGPAIFGRAGFRTATAAGVPT
jgi:hypothetical protein